ncbi:MAG: homoserine kinase [Deltaproteobacteria bacterium]|nr:MAG: homoserine kinase [Deltaproteobacteria bacterium]
MAGWVVARAPATVSNLGPGFDCLGLAVDRWYDEVAVRTVEGGEIRVVEITGDPGLGAERLPSDPQANTAAVAARAVRDRVGSRAGLEIRLHKGLPLGSGLGSSGASAAAGALAAATALGADLAVETLVEAAREGEAVACGAPHVDNVGPCVLGGIVLAIPSGPLRLCRLPVPEDLHLVVYTPGCSVATAEARAVLPDRLPREDHVVQAARLGLLVHALHAGDLLLLGEAMVDLLAEPVRAGLIPGFSAAKAAAYEAGALACGISGAGPTVFAMTNRAGHGDRLLALLDEQFQLAGVPGRGAVCRVGGGAEIVAPVPH